MRLVFMGTPDFAVPSLEALAAAGHDVALVVTRPDRPRGRGLRPGPSPVKQAALRHGLAVLQPERVNREESVAVIAAVQPDALVVVAYGAILKEKLLNLAPLGAINVHASLLPRHRGMAPIQRAIWDGDVETGVTTMYMDKGVDTGDVILMEKTPIDPDETAGELHDRLSVLGAKALVETLDRIEKGTPTRKPQEGTPTHAARLDKRDGWIDWSLPAEIVYNHARAVTPGPGAAASLRGRIILVTSMRPCHGRGAESSLSHGSQCQHEPGMLVGIDGDDLVVACASGSVRLAEVKPAGRQTMKGIDLAHGLRLKPGAMFDSPGMNG